MGKKMLTLRTERGLTQTEMASQLGISASYLNLIEHNQRAVTVPLLLKLSQLFDVALRDFAQGERAHLLADLTEVFEDAIFEGHDVKPADLRDLISTSPAVARAMLALYRTYRKAREDATGMLDRLLKSGISSGGEGVHLPAEEVTDFLQERRNYFPELEEAAGQVRAQMGVDSEGMVPALAGYLNRVLGVEVRFLGPRESKGVLRRYDPKTKTLVLSESVSPQTGAFQLAHQIGLLTQREVFDGLMREAALSTEDLRARCRVALANYFAGAVLMPYQLFLRIVEEFRYDLELLEQYFQTSFEQVCHRLTNLNCPGSSGVPFHLVRVDVAGNMSKHFNGSGIRFARFGGACPRWNVHEAFLTPGVIRIQVSREPEGKTYLCIARTVRKVGGGFHLPPRLFSLEIGCELSHAKQLVYSDGIDLHNPQAVVPIGPGCRQCERADCRQRAFPSLCHYGAVDENVRGLSGYVSAPPATNVD